MKNTWKIYIMALICFSISTSEFVIVGVLDKIAESSNISIAAAGQLITVFALASAIGTPMAIMALGKIDRRKVLMMALSLVVIGSAMIMFASNYTLLLGSRIILAIGAGVFNVTCFTVVAKIATPERQASSIATLSMGFNAALIIGLPIGRVVTAAFGWKAIFLGTAIFALLSIVAVALIIPGTTAETPVPLRNQLALLKSPKILLTLGTSFFWILGYALVYSYITPFLMATSSMSEGIISMALFAFGVATIIGNKVGGVLGDRIGVPRTLVGSMTAHFIVLVLLSVIAGSTVVTILLLMLWAIAAWMPGPIQQYNIISLTPEAPGIMLSLNSSVIQFGFAAGAGIGGVIVNSSSILALSWIGAVFLLIAVFVASASFRQVVQPTMD